MERYVPVKQAREASGMMCSAFVKANGGLRTALGVITYSKMASLIGLGLTDYAALAGQRAQGTLHVHVLSAGVMSYFTPAFPVGSGEQTHSHACTADTTDWAISLVAG